MKINMTCCCGGEFYLEADVVSMFWDTLFAEAERWRKAHALCPTYERTVVTTSEGEDDDQ